MSEIPEWLTEALLGRRPSCRPVDRPAPGVGDIWLAKPAGSHTSRLHVLLVDIYEPALVQALLCCGVDTDMATDMDTVLPGRLTGLSYPMLVHGDLTAPVPVRLLWRRAASIPTKLAMRVRARGERRSTGEDWPEYGRGLPILSRSDVRWDWKLAELARLHRVMAHPQDLGVED